MSRNMARRRAGVGMALVHFFAWVRGRGLTPAEYEQAAYAADDFVFRDGVERWDRAQ